MTLDDRSTDFDAQYDDGEATPGSARRQAAPAPTAAPVVEEAPQRSLKDRLRLPLLLLAPIVLIIGGLWFYLTGGRYESTDNASIQAGLTAVSANVAGPVVSIEVHNNQVVQAGQVLFRIDPAPYQAAVDEAEAALAAARTGVASLHANFAEGEAQVQSAQDRLDYAVREAARQKQLLAEGISSQAQYDQAALAVQTARQAIQTAHQQNQAVVANLSGSVDTPVDRQPAVRRAQAALERARLNLDYTIVRAPQDGVVTKVDQLQLGSYVAVAKPVFTLAGRRLWVEANFKENQLDHMRVGQSATIKVDAFPSLNLHGRLRSFSPGTGNSFALLPPENATGNWVKVVQRLPVEFDIDDVPAGVPLQAGLSVDVTVDTGHQRHLFGSETDAPPAR